MEEWRWPQFGTCPTDLNQTTEYDKSIILVVGIVRVLKLFALNDLTAKTFKSKKWSVLAMCKRGWALGLERNKQKNTQTNFARQQNYWWQWAFDRGCHKHCTVVLWSIHKKTCARGSFCNEKCYMVRIFSFGLYWWRILSYTVPKRQRFAVKITKSPK